MINYSAQGLQTEIGDVTGFKVCFHLKAHVDFICERVIYPEHRFAKGYLPLGVPNSRHEATD